MAAHLLLLDFVPRQLISVGRLAPYRRASSLVLVHRALRSCNASSLTLAPQRPTGIVPLTIPSAHRGKRTKTIISLQDLPQGPIPGPNGDVLGEVPGVVPGGVPGEATGEALAAEDVAEPPKLRSRRSRHRKGENNIDDGNGNGDQRDNKDRKDQQRYPTVVHQARQNMHKFADCVLLTRVGGFYEIYFEHAEEYGPLLNLKVAQKKTNAGPVSMAGFPFFQLDRFLKILVQDLNRSVAIAEEFPNDPSAKVRAGGLIHDRKVARVITPGTLIDENFIDPYANNYVLSVHLPERENVEDGATLYQDGRCVESSGKGEFTSATPDDLSLGLAWMDLSTGHFYVQTCPSSSLQSVLSRVGPKEVILDQALESHESNQVVSLLSEDRHLITYSSRGEHVDPSGWTPMLESPISNSVLASLTPVEVDAGNLLLYYVKDRLRGMSMKLQPPIRYENMHIMAIDKNTMRALEIRQTMRDGAFRGSLLHSIRRTVTKGGARLLNEWLSAPSTSLDVITERQDLVEHFVRDENLRQTILCLLKRSHDSQRLVQKFALGRGDPDDLLSLASTIYTTEEIHVILKNAVTALEEGDTETTTALPCLNSQISRINLQGPLKVAHRITDAIDKEGLETQHQLQDQEAGAMLALAEEVVTAQGTGDDAAAVLPRRSAANPDGKAAAAANKKQAAGGRTNSLREHYASDNEAWMMKPSASAALTRLHGELQGLATERETLEEALRERFKATTLTLKWTPTLGHICHVKGKDAKTLTPTVPGEGPVIVSSSRSTRSLHVPEWTALGNQLDQVRIRIRAEENRVFSALRQAVIRNLVLLRRNGAVLEEMDVAAGFAVLAQEQGLVRPILRNDAAVGHNIVGGRHPTVERGLGEQGRNFVGNDCFVGSGSGQHGRAWLITGPNMAGKSTFLRQNALITILAQVGCFVPADFAEMGIVDAIFSRVGSADSLYYNQSTFMVEMLETAAILRNATPKSFVIMDEVGRGTSPDDGAAVAYACLNHLATVNRCRSLFATHFHSLADLVREAKLDVSNGGPVDMYCTDVEENDETGGFVYIHKLRKGINRQSHALKVAQLAGIPQRAIEMADKIMADKQHGAQEERL